MSETEVLGKRERRVKKPVEAEESEIAGETTNQTEETEQQQESEPVSAQNAAGKSMIKRPPYGGASAGGKSSIARRPNNGNNPRRFDAYSQPLLPAATTMRVIDMDPFRPEYYSESIDRIIGKPIPTIDPPDLTKYFEKREQLEKRQMELETTLTYLRAEVDAIAEDNPNTKIKNLVEEAQEIRKKISIITEKRKGLQAVMDERQEEFKILVDRLRKNGGLLSEEEIKRRIDMMHTEMQTESTDNCFSLASLAKPNISKTGLIKLKKSSYLAHEKKKLEEIDNLKDTIPLVLANKAQVDQARQRMADANKEFKELGAEIYVLRDEERAIQKTIDDLRTGSQENRPILNAKIKERNGIRDQISAVRDELRALEKSKRAEMKKFDFVQAQLELRYAQGSAEDIQALRQNFYKQHGYQIRLQREAIEKEMAEKEKARKAETAKKAAAEKLVRLSLKKQKEEEPIIIVDKEQQRLETEAMEALRLKGEIQKREREMKKIREDAERADAERAKAVAREEEAQKRAALEAAEILKKAQQEREEEIEEQMAIARENLARKKLATRETKQKKEQEDASKSEKQKERERAEREKEKERRAASERDKRTQSGTGGAPAHAAGKNKKEKRSEPVGGPPKTKPEITQAKIDAEERKRAKNILLANIARASQKEEEGSTPLRNYLLYGLAALFFLILIIFIGNAYGRAPVKSLPSHSFEPPSEPIHHLGVPEGDYSPPSAYDSPNSNYYDDNEESPLRDYDDE